MPGDRPAVRSDWTVDEIRAVYDAPLMDLVYRAGATELLRVARSHGARTLDGLEVLVAQGALSFALWTGRPAPLDVMHRAARAQEPSG